MQCKISWVIAFPVVCFIVVLPHSVHGLWTENHYVLCSFQLSQLQLKSYSFNPLWVINTTFVQETSNPAISHFGANNWNTFSKKYSRPFTSEQFHWFIQLIAKKRCNTSQGLGAFFFQSCDRLFFLFLFLFLFFFLVLVFLMVTSD